uniref:Uncharacterized protein n=1 Tax=Cacopsylla melanoneura TaxID=428564 RepID=A0A8D8Z079_9HEMI
MVNVHIVYVRKIESNSLNKNQGLRFDFYFRKLLLEKRSIVEIKEFLIKQIKIKSILITIRDHTVTVNQHLDQLSRTYLVGSRCIKIIHLRVGTQTTFSKMF